MNENYPIIDISYYAGYLMQQRNAIVESFVIKNTLHNKKKNAYEK